MHNKVHLPAYASAKRRADARRAPAKFRFRAHSILLEELQMKKLLFVVDPLDQFKVYKDTTFSIMREASGAATS